MRLKMCLLLQKLINYVITHSNCVGQVLHLLTLSLSNSEITASSILRRRRKCRSDDSMAFWKKKKIHIYLCTFQINNNGKTEMKLNKQDILLQHFVISVCLFVCFIKTNKSFSVCLVNELLSMDYGKWCHYKNCKH